VSTENDRWKAFMRKLVSVLLSRITDAEVDLKDVGLFHAYVCRGLLRVANMTEKIR
jgi:hypothetical protein